MSVIKSLFAIQCCVSDMPGMPRSDDKVVYLAYDQASGGYPWFPGNWNSAHLFKSYEEAMKEIASLKKEEPTVYNSGKSVEFSQHALPSMLRGMAGGRIDNDGYYRFCINVVEIKGNTLLTSRIFRRHQLIVEAEQHYNKPNTPPSIKLFEETFDENGERPVTKES